MNYIHPSAKEQNESRRYHVMNIKMAAPFSVQALILISSAAFPLLSNQWSNLGRSTFCNSLQSLLSSSSLEFNFVSKAYSYGKYFYSV